MEGTRTYLSVPLHDGRQFAGVGEAPTVQPRNYCEKSWRGSSLIPANFNKAWVEAVVRAEAGEFTHFAMQHSDVVAEPGWVDILHDEMRRTGADLISAVVPLKEESGRTSMGVDVSRSPHFFKQFTMREIANFAPTFSAEDAGYPGCALVVNTGLWLAKLNQPWNKKICFAIPAFIDWDRTPPFIATEPEDWLMSRQLFQAGAKVMATTKVKLKHMIAPTKGYENQGAWGSMYDCHAAEHWSSVEGYAEYKPQPDGSPFSARRVDMMERMQTMGGSNGRQ